MTVELTLKIEENLVEPARKFSRKTGTHISKLVSDYFALLDTDSVQTESELTLSVRSLLGSLKGAKIT
ncbi:MAG: DUF6364 family protein [Candidatus Hodarchaeota archaeon]